MRKVLIESPLKGTNYINEEMNKEYIDLCIYDCLMKGEAPVASHKTYLPALDDRIPEQRELGINAGLALLEVVDASVVYQDLGISDGMKKGINKAIELNVTVEFRKLPEHVFLRLITKFWLLEEYVSSKTD